LAGRGWCPEVRCAISHALHAQTATRHLKVCTPRPLQRSARRPPNARGTLCGAGSPERACLHGRGHAGRTNGSDAAATPCHTRGTCARCAWGSRCARQLLIEFGARHLVKCHAWQHCISPSTVHGLVEKGNWKQPATRDPAITHLLRDAVAAMQATWCQEELCLSLDTAFCRHHCSIERPARNAHGNGVLRKCASEMTLFPPIGSCPAAVVSRAVVAHMVHIFTGAI